MFQKQSRYSQFRIAHQKAIIKKDKLLIYNTKVVYQFLDPCLRRDDRQGWNRLKKRVIPAQAGIQYP
ncbi:MAG: hypothetical protein JRE20_07755 [Deltaproteobacteria bacterium]|nr:hypothetical protein [Deltaproteobacteria bacterium]